MTNSDTLSEAYARIATREKAKKKPMLTIKIRYDGFQYAFPPEPGCHNYTYMGRGDGHGATICVPGVPDEKPDDATVERLLAEKIQQFRAAANP